MNQWSRKGLTWAAPALVVAVYAGLLLTNGHLAQLFTPAAWGSYLYANVWEHLLRGSLAIDPQFANGEYFVVGPGQYVTYFGIMPALVRGMASLYSDVYAYGLANMSMILALLLALGSVWYVVQQIATKRLTKIIGASIVMALLLASPISYVLTWSWTYHEVILWGVAWAMLFVSLFTLWLFAPARFTRWHGLLLGAAVGMAVLSRPTIGLTLIVPYAFLCGLALWRLKDRESKLFRTLLPGMLACFVLALSVLTVNYARWGSPFTFVRITQNVQFVELYPERRAHIEAAGEFTISRLPTSAFYYLVPTTSNVTAKPPFITIDRELHEFNHAPHYDYIEGSRVPIPLSMLYLLVLAAMGIMSLRRLKRSEKIASAWLLAGASLTCLALLTVYAVAVRYTAEFLPGVVFLALAYIAMLERQKTAALSRPRLWALVITAVVSVYITLATTLAYKEFVWDVPAQTRESLRQFIRYSPAPHETKHIIDGKRFSIY